MTMTIEERDTARAIQAIARKLREPAHIDWEQRRYEIAKDCLCAILPSSDIFNSYLNGCLSKSKCNAISDAKLATYVSLICADVLIERLKKEKCDAEQCNKSTDH